MALVNRVFEARSGARRQLVEIRKVDADDPAVPCRWRYCWIHPAQTPESGGNWCWEQTWDRWIKESGAREIAAATKGAN